MEEADSLKKMTQGITMADLDALKQHISDMNLGLKTTDPSTGAKMKKSEIYSTMPSRVKTNFDIKVDIVPGVGRGIILLEDVKAGDLIFKISNPMFLVVENGEYAMANTCDNCFAANPDGGGSTDGKKVKLSGCVRCKVVHYCGKDCQVEAWNHHHKNECKALKRMLKWEGSEKQKMVYMARIRQAVRILQYHALNNDVPDSVEWAEVKSLLSHTKSHDKDTIATGREIARGLVNFTDTDLNLNDILDLLFALQSNEIGISLPILRPHGEDYIPYTPPTFKVGDALDPFVAMLNHSCNPNVYWSFEGREIRIFAYKAISKGEELCITYVSDLGDYRGRRELLKQTWSFDCNCVLCKEGPKGLNAAGPLGEHVLNMKTQGWPSTPEAFEQLKRTLLSIETSGFGPNTYPLAWFYMCLWGNHTLVGESSAALKLALKLYYQIHPAQDAPVIDASVHQDNLYHLINALKDKSAISGAPQVNMPSIYRHLRKQHVKNASIIYGSDSKIAKYESESFDTWKRNNPETEASSEDLVSDINLLLKWAGVPEVSEKLIIGD